ncbi:unnamed protein product [Sympodiomycopsis kandeliae]
MSSTPTPSSSTSHPQTDIEYQISSAPNHPVSAITFNPAPSCKEASRQVLVSSWDSTVRLYQLPDRSLSDKSNNIQQLHTFKHEAPVLDVCWINDTLAASGGIDRRVRILNLTTGESTIIGKHTSAISRIRYEPSTNLLLTSSWDRTLQLWDPQSEPPRHLKTLTQPDKILAMDVSPPYAGSSLLSSQVKRRVVLALAGRQVRIYDLEEVRRKVDNSDSDADSEWEPEQSRESSLKYMIRDVRCNAEGIGYATSSVEGRVAVEFFDTSSESQGKKFAFKCHRTVVDGIDTVYPVNAMGFNPLHGTFFSLGGDAHLCYWDPYLKKRIRQLPQYPSPLSTAGFSADGNTLVIASGASNLEQVGGEVGGIGNGGEGHVALWVREKAGEECKPKPAK